jgi:hypothetical protein
MPALQSAFTATIPNGFPGMIANAEIQNRFTRTCEDAGGIAFGAACFRGAGDHGCTATPTAAKFLGIAIVDHGQVRRTASAGADRYDQNDNVPLMQRGVVWVTSSIAVADGDPVYVTPAGLFTNSAAGNVQLVGWIWVDTLAAAGVARISNNI